MSAGTRSWRSNVLRVIRLWAFRRRRVVKVLVNVFTGALAARIGLPMSDETREPTLVACLEVYRRLIFRPHVRGFEDFVVSTKIDSPNEFACSPEFS